jgi:multiple sugar transport system permease protein
MTTQSAVQRPRGRWTDEQRREVLWALAFLSPWIIGFLVFTAGPMLWSLYLSFTDYDPLVDEANFIGLANYAQMLEDPRVPLSLWNTFYFTVLYVPLSMIFGVFLATLLNRVGGRSAGWFRTAFYLPNVTPAVAVGTLFLLLLTSNGLLNQVLGVVGIDGPSWFNDPAWIKNGIVIMMLWSIGGTVIILFAALRNVPVELYEAARIDGASAWQRFRHVTLPGLAPTLVFVTVITMIGFFQLFVEPYVMTAGGPLRSTTSVVLLMYEEGFRWWRMGAAAAIAFVLFVLILLWTLLQLWVERRTGRTA